MVIGLVAACGPLDRSGRRPLVIDVTPLGTSRAGVKAWHLDNDWCGARTWEQSDEYVTCAPRAYRPGGGSRSGDERIRSFFHFTGETMDASVVFAPVVCTHTDCNLRLGVDGWKAGPPFIVFGAGLIATPTTAGRDAAQSYEMPGDQRRLLDAMKLELVRRYGEPDWTSANGAAMTWHQPTDEIGLFLAADALWTVETHQVPQGPPGLTSAR